MSTFGDFMIDEATKSREKLVKLEAELSTEKQNKCFWMAACADANKRIRELEEAANEVLRVYMPQFNDSRTVDDCLVGLAAAVADVATAQREVGK